MEFDKYTYIELDLLIKLLNENATRTIFFKCTYVVKESKKKTNDETSVNGTYIHRPIGRYLQVLRIVVS